MAFRELCEMHRMGLLNLAAAFFHGHGERRFS